MCAWHKPGSFVGGREHTLWSMDCIARKRWKVAAGAQLLLQLCMQDWAGSEFKRGFDLDELRLCRILMHAVRFWVITES